MLESANTIYLSFGITLLLVFLVLQVSSNRGFIPW